MLRQDLDELLGDLRAHVRRLGTLTADYYELSTPLARVTVSPETLELEIIRRENNNPVVGVNVKGQVYRYHGEFAHLHDHLAVLLYGHPRKVAAATRLAIGRGVEAEAKRFRRVVGEKSLPADALDRVQAAASALDETGRRILAGTIPDPDYKEPS